MESDIRHRTQTTVFIANNNGKKIKDKHKRYPVKQLPGKVWRTIV